jgi:hypothetical protein
VIRIRQNLRLISLRQAKDVVQRNSTGRSGEASMEKPLIVAALACQPGDRFIDRNGKIPRGLQFMDFVLSVEHSDILVPGWRKS